MDPNVKRKVITFGSIFTGLILLGIITATASLRTLDETGNSQRDKSGIDKSEQDTDPEGGQSQTGVTYSGFVDLSRRGLTSYQTNAVKFALYNHASNATSFTIDPGSIKQSVYNPDNPTDLLKIRFNLQVDDKSYNATVDKYTDLVTVRVYLRNKKDNKLDYDSKPIDGTKLQSTRPDLGD